MSVKLASRKGSSGKTMLSPSRSFSSVRNAQREVEGRFQLTGRHPVFATPSHGRMLQQADERFPVTATPPELSHLNASGEAHMVDVGGRAVSDRVAVAEGFIELSPEALALVVEGRAAKGLSLIHI